MRLLSSLLVWTVLAPGVVRGGTIVPTPTLPGYVHEIFGVEHGLPKAGINDVLQTRDGYLWIATFDGLARFDGMRFEIFDSERFPALGSNRIVNLLETRDATLWILSEQGHLSRYQRGIFTACTLNTPDRGSCNQVGERAPPALFVGRTDRDFGRGLFEDPGGTLWVGSSAGLFYFDNDVLLRDPSLEGWVLSVLTASSGQLWVGTRGNLWTGELGRLRPVEGAAGLEVNSLAEDLDGQVWTGTNRGIGRVQDGQFELQLVGEGLPAKVARDAHGVLWAAVYDRLLRLDSGGSFRSFPSQTVREPMRLETQISASGAPDDSWIVWDSQVLRNNETILDLDSYATLTIDRSGTIWIGQHGSGKLIAFHPERISTLTEGLPDGVLYPVHEDPERALWVGGASFLARLVPGAAGFRSRTGPGPAQQAEARSVTSMLHDRHGKFWIGSDHGLFALAADGFEGPHGPPTLNQRVLALTEDRRGRLWVGTVRGLFRYDSTADSPWSQWGEQDGHPDLLGVRVIREASDGMLWFGTTGRGVTRFDGQRFTTLRGLSSDLVRAIWEAPDGHLWIATENRGLNRLDPRDVGSPDGPRIAMISRRHGLPSSGIHSLVDDGFGNLWMSSNQGIFRARLSDLNAVADGQRESLECIHFDERDGMRDREANGGVQQAGLRAADGMLYFPTMAGLVRIDPRKAHGADPPPIRLETLRTEGEDILVRGGVGIHLTPHQNSFEIAYTAITFRAPGRLRFRYRLTPYQGQWTDAGTRRVARYVQVPAGRYTFEVETLVDGAWSPRPARVEIEIAPGLFETLGFRILCALAAVGLFAGIVRLREMQSQKRRRKLEQEVERRTEVIAQQAERLRDLDELKSQFFANVSHELRTPLTLTLGPLRDAIDGAFGRVGGELASQLRLAYRSTERLGELIDQLLDIAKLDSGNMELRPRMGDLAAFLRERVESFLLLAERRQIDLSIALPDDPVETRFDRAEFQKAVDNLLSNALKFTPESGHVRLTLELSGQQARVAVADDGPGISAAQMEKLFERFYRCDQSGEIPGTGLGLALAHQLVELHGGTIEVDSEVGRGSTFTILLPIRRDASRAEPAATEPTQAQVPTVRSGTLRGRASEDRPVVLLVDDNADVRAYIRRHLMTAYQILEAGDGAEALALARQTMPDMIVADIMMPRLDGPGLFRKLREDPELTLVPVIFVTAKASPKSRLEALREGVDDYLVKPFDPRELHVRIDNLLASRRRLVEHIDQTPDDLVPADDLLPAETSEIDPADRSFLRRVQETIAEHLGDQDFTVERLAESLGCSRTYLFRKLRQLIDQSPSSLIRSLRLRRAAKLLQANAGTVTEVAYSVGFKSVAHFSNLFLEVYGERPSDFLARQHEE